eukprot:scaffold1476_cov264-Pinguiococcus_pyrenoidosus.AAC.2
MKGWPRLTLCAVPNRRNIATTISSLFWHSRARGARPFRRPLHHLRVASRDILSVPDSLQSTCS